MALAACAVLRAAPASAQYPAEVRGRVTEAGSGAAVAGARVEVVGGSLATVTAPDGGFALRGVLPGRRELRVTAFAHRERTVAVEAENGRTAWVAITLQPRVLALDPLAVRAERAAPGATTIGRAEIEASGAADVADVLRAVPGVTVTREGGPGAPARISIRGSSADQVLVLLDGAEVNNALTGDADLSTLPAGVVERVTVIPGAQSARYGGRALAGVVSVETRRPRGAELGVQGAMGSWGARSAGGSLGGAAPTRLGDATALASAEWRSARGDFRFEVPAFRGGGTAVRANGDAESLSLFAAAGLARGARELRARAEAFAVERGMPGPIGQPSPDARQEQHRIAAGLSARGPLLGLAWAMDADVQRQAAGYADPDPPLGSPYEDDVRATAAGIALSASGGAGAITLTGGGELRGVRFRSTMLAPGAPDGQTLGAAWLQGRWSGAAGGWALDVTPGARADWNTLLRGAALSPRVASVAARGRVALRGAVGGAFSPPSLADQFFHEGVLVRPNPALRPERVRLEVEGGIDLRDVPLGRAVLEAGFTAFRADVDDMILWFPDHQFVWSPQNFDVRRAGWEAAARARLPGGELGGSVSHAAVEYDSPALSGQVAYRPRWTAAAQGSARAAGFGVELRARWVGERRSAAGSELNLLPAHWLADAALTRGFRAGAWGGDARLEVQNLADASAAMLVDYPYPGRGWSLGLRLRREPRAPAVRRADTPNKEP
ncbi:MAG TPA: TonB-dependent receptor plug domain-containing protein [Longimicrobium sp.]|nr:TonB-dependent receptor plug domain-containing protein [Longimicrobium sp.]